jgi:hypothetical protein
MSKRLSPDQIEANKALGLHPSFVEAAFTLPAEITPEYLDETFPAWRAAGKDMAHAIAHHDMGPQCLDCQNPKIDCICDQIEAAS